MEIESNKKFSESLLWDLQTEAYKQFGPSAWAQKGVPFYLTSNPLIAKQFAQSILGYLRDCMSSESATPLNFDEPVYIFDLGAGSGRLGYLCLKHLLHLIESLFPRKIRVKYVMTDISKDNLAFLENHPYLQPFVHRGSLDFAYYRHDQKEPIELIHSKEILNFESVKNPIVLICTYFFDTIPQDLFRINNGVLEEGRVTLKVPDNFTVTDKLNPEVIEKLEANYHYSPISNPEYYSGQPELNSILSSYSKWLKDGVFLFPSGGFQTLRYFSELSQGRLLLLAGDQGVCTEEQIRVWGEPKISKHATFSIAVDYHAIAQYFRQQGGFGWLTHFSDPQFVVICGGLGGTEKIFPETNLVFREQIDAFEPVHYWKLTTLSEAVIENLSLDQLLIFIQLGNWDPIAFYSFFAPIRQKAASADEKTKNILAQTMVRVWDHFFPVDPQEGYFLMNLGVLFFEIDHTAEALLFFKRASDMLGRNQDLLLNIAKCYLKLGDQESALEYFQKLNPA